MKEVKLALVSYTDETGTPLTTLCVVGDKKIHMLEGRVLGFSKETTGQGPANEWFRKGVMKKLGKEE